MRLIIAAAVLLLAAPASAQTTRTLDQFVTEANRVPLNPTSALRADARRLMREFSTSMGVVSARIEADRAAGRTPAACPPERIQLNPRELLAELNAIPQARRASMSVPDGLQHWMAGRYPCGA
ncbi:hypothetical protein [Brevundimonas balnearis]|uniref:Rap1a immunity protein domain-containing protein n=1 Tax=Brevundimonas balnearis TaxID=1572858 RepID=A0ABV6R0L2_9CAUL